MKLHYDADKRELLVLLDGELDHHRSALLRNEIDTAVYMHMPAVLILDFHDVTFMDSSGIGLVMGRYKLMNERGGTVTVAKTPAYIGKVMRVSGVGKLARIVNDYTLPREDEQEVMKIETTNQ